MTAAPSPLTVKQAGLQAHLRATAGVLGHVLEGNRVDVEADWQTVPLIAGLVGAGCERIHRNRGGSVNVAPFAALNAHLLAWLSYREEWDVEAKRVANPRYLFRTASLSVYFGCRRDVYKPQMFRAEWSGWAQWAGGRFGFQGSDAGHPHWQFDAIESLRENDQQERSETILKWLAEETSANERVREFEAPPTSDVKDIITTQEFARIHFASAAAWWKPTPLNAHAHSPKTTAEIQTWLSRSLTYLRDELVRLRSA
jgi:hypothetical protein